MRSIKEQELPNSLEVQTQEEIKYADFREAIRMLTQVATYHVGQRDNRHEVVDISRIRELLRMNPPSFTGSGVTENPENFIEELKRVFEVMHVAESERVHTLIRTWSEFTNSPLTWPNLHQQNCSHPRIVDWLTAPAVNPWFGTETWFWDS